MCFIIMLDTNCVLVYICLQFVTCSCFISFLYAHIYITFSLRLHKTMFCISSLYMLKHCMHFSELYTLYIVLLITITCIIICSTHACTRIIVHVCIVYPSPLTPFPHYIFFHIPVPIHNTLLHFIIHSLYILTKHYG